MQLGWAAASYSGPVEGYARSHPHAGSNNFLAPECPFLLSLPVNLPYFGPRLTFPLTTSRLEGILLLQLDKT